MYLSFSPSKQIAAELGLLLIVTRVVLNFVIVRLAPIRYSLVCIVSNYLVAL
jgi:hypothetical protein